MAQVIWTEPARADLEAIHDYIAIESPVAAIALVGRIVRHVEQLGRQPDSGSWLPELGRSLGRSINEFKRASNELKNTLDEEIRLEDQKGTDRQRAPEPVRPQAVDTHDEQNVARRSSGDA